MQPLSATLDQMTLPEAMPREPQLGLTTTAGTISPSLQERIKPLTEKQVTEIASQTLLKSPVIFSEKKRKFEIEYDERTQSERQIYKGDVDEVDIAVYIKPSCEKRWIKAALAHSPKSGVVAHITRLTLHKRLGSNDTDRALLLHDYADALSHYPEFIVYLVCKAFWENTSSPFCPKISDLKNMCEAVQQLFQRELVVPMIGAQPTKPIRIREDDTDAAKKLRRDLCNHIVSKGGEDFFDDNMMSNYLLETVAKSRWGWKKPEQNNDHR